MNRNINLDKEKIKNIGGTSLDTISSFSENLERCHNFRSPQNESEKLVIHIPLENLCLK